MKKLSFLLVALLFSVAGFSQESSISFNKTTHDFGTVSEETGNISYDFEFTNTGNTPLALTNVKASCGCTTPSWTKEPVAPGKKGVIKVTYATTGRAYKFNKPVTVTSSADGVTSTTTLYIKGDVTPKNQAPNFQATSSTASFDGLLLSKNQLLFALAPNDKKMDFIQMENKGDTSLKIELGETPDYITVTSNAKELKPGKKGMLAIVCDTSKMKEGIYNDSFFVQISGDSDKKINQKVTVQTIVKN